MKYLIIFCLLLALSLGFLGCGPAQPASTSLPTVKIDCDSDTEIYKNNTDKAINVTVQATDDCEDFDSSLDVYNTDGEVIKDYKIEDGKTGASTFSVPAGGSINFDCSGSKGSCSYTLSIS